MHLVRLAALALLGGLCLVPAAPVHGPGSGGDATGSTLPDSTSDGVPAAPVHGPGSGSGSDVSASTFPDSASTGVPPGIELVPYTGPCTLTEPVELSGVDATETCPAIMVQAAGVVIQNSLVPRVEATAAEQDPSYSVEITDSEVRAGAWVGGAVWGSNIVAIRVEVTGGQHSFHCNGRCVLEDSWLHDQFNPEGQAAHNNAFISNGGTDMVVRHNTLHCTPALNSTGGGCTADLSLFGDFQPISRVTVDRNLFRANGSSIPWCVYGGESPGKPYPVATDVVFTDNVFERGVKDRCGVYGPVTSFDPEAEGNAWTGNTWDDGAVVLP